MDVVSEFGKTVFITSTYAIKLGAYKNNYVIGKAASMIEEISVVRCNPRL